MERQGPSSWENKNKICGQHEHFFTRKKKKRKKENSFVIEYILKPDCNVLHGQSVQETAKTGRNFTLLCSQANATHYTHFSR